MDKLAEVNPEELPTTLAGPPTAKAAKRLMVALAYADGVRVETLSERYGIPRATVYPWLDRFEHQSIDETIEDDSRPGQPSKFDVRSVSDYLMSWQRHRLNWDTTHRNGRLNGSSITLSRRMMSPIRWATSVGCFANSQLMLNFIISVETADYRQSYGNNI